MSDDAGQPAAARPNAGRNMLIGCLAVSIVVLVLLVLAIGAFAKRSTALLNEARAFAELAVSDDPVAAYNRLHHLRQNLIAEEVFVEQWAAVRARVGAAPQIEIGAPGMDLERSILVYPVTLRGEAGEVRVGVAINPNDQPPQVVDFDLPAAAGPPAAGPPAAEDAGLSPLPQDAPQGEGQESSGG